MTQNNRPIPGSLKERDGMYTAILNVYDEIGKRKQKQHAPHIPAKGNKRKAQAAQDEPRI